MGSQKRVLHSARAVENALGSEKAVTACEAFPAKTIMTIMPMACHATAQKMLEASTRQVAQHARMRAWGGGATGTQQTRSSVQ